MIESLFGGSAEIINILGGIGFFVVVVITGYVAFFYIRKMKTATAEGEKSAEEWDGIYEFKNPLPVGWAVILIASIFWAIWYWTVGYPLKAYSQIGEWNQETKEYLAKFEETWKNPDQDTLKAMGESIFLAQCAQCHGLQADGLDGKAANLVEYGTVDHVAYVVKHGSKGLGYPGGEMPGQEGLFNTNTGQPISDAEIKTVSTYVANGMSGEGEAIYQGTCAACHQADGTGSVGGMQMYPSLKNYGSVEYAVKAVKHGKKGFIGNMPAFEKAGFLTDIQYEAVATYILSIGQ